VLRFASRPYTIMSANPTPGFTRRWIFFPNRAVLAGQCLDILFTDVLEAWLVMEQWAQAEGPPHPKGRDARTTPSSLFIGPAAA